jgi:hypothetical protein
MDKHTRGECVSSTKEERKEGTLQSIPTKEDEVQGLYKVCTERMYKGMLQRLYKVYNKDRVIQEDLKATDYWRN